MILPNLIEGQSLTTQLEVEHFDPFGFLESSHHDTKPPRSNQNIEPSRTDSEAADRSSPSASASFVIRNPSLPKRFLNRPSPAVEVGSLAAFREAVSRAVLAKWRSLVATHEGRNSDEFAEATLEVSLDDTGKVLDHRLVDGSFGTVQESLCRLAVEQVGPYPALSRSVRDALSAEPRRVAIRLSPEIVEFPALLETNVGSVWPAPWPDPLARQEFETLRYHCPQR